MPRESKFSSRLHMLKTITKAAIVAVAFVPSVLASEPSALKFEPLYEPGNGGATVSLRISPFDGKRIISGGDMLGTATSIDGGNSWQATLGFKSGEMADVSFHPTDPKIVWMGTCSGPYRSDDGGVNWVEQRDGFPPVNGGAYSAMVERVLFDPANVHRLLAIGGSSRGWADCATFGWVWESTDDGQHWSHLTTIKPEGSTLSDDKGVNLIAASYLPKSTSTIVALGGGTGVFISTDSGKSWQASSGGLPSKNVQRLAVHPSDPNVLWVTIGAYKSSDQSPDFTPGGVYKSKDGGRTWANSSDGLAQARDADFHMTSSYRALAVSPADPQMLYTNDESWKTGVIYKSTDGGSNWQPVATRQNVGTDETAPERKALLGLGNTDFCTQGGLSLPGMEFDPKDPRIAYGFGAEFICKTVDGGKTWTDSTSFRPDPALKDHWRGRGYTGWCSTNIAFNPYKPAQSILQGMDASRLWISDDNLKSWRYPNSKPIPWLGGNDVTFTPDGHIYSTTGQFGSFNGILRSTDGGATFETLADAAYGLPKAGFVPGPEGRGIYADPAHSAHVWAVLGGELYASTNGGDHWTVIDKSHDFWWIAGDPKQAGRFYISARDGVFVTDDGHTFKSIGGPRPGGRGRLNVDSSGRVIACQWRSGRAGVWRYTPATGTWERLLDDYQAFEAVADPTDPKRLAMISNEDPFHDYAGGNGVWVSTDDGKSWSQQDTGLPLLRGQAISFDPTGTRLLVGTFGRGFFTADWPKSVTPAGDRRYVTADDDRMHASVNEAAPDSQTVGSVTLKNGSFVAGTDIPSGWERGWVGHGDIKIARDTSVFKQGPASLAIETVGDTIGGVQEMVDANENESFVFSGFVKSTGNVKVNVAVQPFDGTYHPISFIQSKFVMNDTDWSDFSKTIDLPAGTRHCAFVLLVEGEGKAWVDELQIKPVPPEVAPTAFNAITLNNPSFAAGDGEETRGWDQRWGSVKAARDTSVFKSAPAALRVETTERGQAQAGQMIEITGGTRLKIGGWVKTQGDVKLNFMAQSFTSDWHPIDFQQLKYAQNDSDWSEGQKEITVPIKAARVLVGLLVEGSGRAWLDEVTISSPDCKVTVIDEPAAPVASSATDPRQSAPAAGKPNTPAWGFYPPFPAAWLNRLNDQLQANKAAVKDGDAKAIFIGDSITEGWGENGHDVWNRFFEPLKAINFGIGGDSTRQVLYRIDQGILDGLHPKVVVLMIGTNNLYGDFNAGSNEEIADGVLACVKAVQTKCPDAKVLLLGILPRQNDYFIGRVNAINAITSKAADGKSVYFLDMGAQFRKDEKSVKPELYKPDQLHLMPPGYELWHQTMAETFDRFVK